MADYEVRQMASTYSPTNGFGTLMSVMPPEWQTSDPGNGPRMVIDAWSGGGKGKGTKLIVHGGGHNDSANNGVYVFDFNGSTRPTGWTLPAISPVSAVRSGVDTYADGKPVSTHSYAGMLSTSTHLYRFMGARWNPNGGFTSACWRFDLATSTWTKIGDYGGQLVQPLCAYDETADKILVTTDDNFYYQFVNCATGAMSAVKTHNAALGYGSVIGYDSLRRRIVEIGANHRIWNVDWTGESVATSTYTPTGAVTGASLTAACVLYDELKDVFWIFGGQRGAPGHTTIYEMNAGTFAVTAHALSSTIGISLSADNQGSWDRYIWMNDWRAIGFVSNINVAPVVIKLPA